MTEAAAAIELVKLWLTDNVTHVKAMTGDWKTNVTALYREAIGVIRENEPRQA